MRVLLRAMASSRSLSMLSFFNLREMGGDKSSTSPDLGASLMRRALSSPYDCPYVLACSVRVEGP